MSRSYLLPRVIASGRTWIRRAQATLTIEELPQCAEPPFTLVSVTALEPEVYDLRPSPMPMRQVVHAVIPLHCQVRDRCGCLQEGRSSIEVDIQLHAGCGTDLWQSRLMIQASVRLLCQPCAQETPVFDVFLEVLADAYLVRWEHAPHILPPCPSSRGRTELPLYPELRTD